MGNRRQLPERTTLEGAERAWRLYDEEEEQWLDHWLITSGTRIVEFVSGNVEMNDSQKATVGEKLLGN